MEKMKVVALVIMLLVFKSSICLAQAGMETDENVVIKNDAKRFADLIASKDVQPLAKGFIDVTKPPYNAKGDGITDDTHAIQAAMNDAYEGNFVTFFPGDKVYLVSDQLKCIKDRQNASRKFAYQLVGSSIGKSPVIKLKDGTNALNGQTLVFYEALFPKGIKKVSQPSRHYGSIFRGINIDMGNNPEVDALSMSGAQLCSIEDTRIYGKNFNAGIHNLPGSGGFTVNVSVDGGNYGIWQDEFRPNPTINGLTLSGQLKAGVFLTESRGPLIITGFKIVSPAHPAADYYAISAKNGTSSQVNVHAALCLTDGSIEMQGSNKTTAILNYNQSVTLTNVYVKSSTIIASGLQAKVLNGSLTQWFKISSYLFTSKSDGSSVQENYVRINNQTDDYQFNEPLIPATLPLPDLISKHTWVAMPSWNDNNLVDITTYGATPEDVSDNDDDGKAIQKAIDDVSNPASKNFGKTVFIPRGHFHIGEPLYFKSGLKIIGASKTISAIQALGDRVYGANAMIQSSDDAKGSLIMSDFAIVPYPNASFLNIRTNNTILRDITTELVAKAKKTGKNPKAFWSNKPVSPLISFTGNAGGKIYGLSMDQVGSSYGIDGSSRISGFHFVKVNATIHPLSFYQFSIEHLQNSPQVMFENAKNVSIYGFKYEGHKEVLNVINSDNINISGGSGNFSLGNDPDDKAVIVINNSKNLQFQSLYRKADKNQDGNKLWLLSNKDSTSYDYGILLYKIGN